jgi:hypothetical protein
MPRGGRTSTTKPIREPDSLGRFICNKCKILKCKDEFHKDNTTFHKIHSYCKVCNNKLKKRKTIFNSQIIGFYEFNCDFCGKKNITKSAIKYVCNAKCRYEYSKVKK